MPHDAAVFGVDKVLMMRGGVGSVFDLQFDVIDQRRAFVVIVFEKRMRQNHQFRLRFVLEFAIGFQRAFRSGKRIGGVEDGSRFDARSIEFIAAHGLHRFCIEVGDDLRAINAHAVAKLIEPHVRQAQIILLGADQGEVLTRVALRTGRRAIGLVAGRNGFFAEEVEAALHSVFDPAGTLFACLVGGGVRAG